jgi:hypothetical protein
MSIQLDRTVENKPLLIFFIGTFQQNFGRVIALSVSLEPARLSGVTFNRQSLDAFKKENCVRGQMLESISHFFEGIFWSDVRIGKTKHKQGRKTLAGISRIAGMGSDVGFDTKVFTTTVDFGIVCIGVDRLETNAKLPYFCQIFILCPFAYTTYTPYILLIE